MARAAAMRLRVRRLSICWLASIVLASTLVAGQTGAQQQATSMPNHDKLKHVSSNVINSSDGAKIAPARNDVKSHQQEEARKCTRQSIMLARQMLVHELEHINKFNSMWFSDLDRDELIEGQKDSLSNIVMSGYGTRLLLPDGQPLIEIESSYFRNQAHNTNQNQQYNLSGASNNQQGQPMAIKLIRRHHDRCSLSADGSQYAYMFGLSVGPIEHHLDVLYNLPKDLSLGQPLDWRYAQITIRVPKMVYEVTLAQMANYNLNSWTPFLSNCPLEVSKLFYLPPSNYSTSSSPVQTGAGQQQLSSGNKAQLSISSSGLALNNQTIAQVERLFDDYTRPIVSRRLRQMLRFYLNAKTLPLSSACAQDHC